MTLFSPTTIFAAILLLYLSSFLVFALVRIATGVSIQRLGYFSLRRITYAPKDGVLIEIRGLGLSLHPPSFAQPTWVSLKLTELKVSFAPHFFSQHAANAKNKQHVSGRARSSEKFSQLNESGTADPTSPRVISRSQTWRTLTSIKEGLKRLHRQIQWLALVDVAAINTTVNFVDAGKIEIGSLSLAVDTRRKMADMSKFFRRKKDKSTEERPAEWIVTVRNVLFVVNGREPTELLDNMGVNIHGLLYKDREGPRDASVDVKIGRLHVPYDDLKTVCQKIRMKKPRSNDASSETDDDSSYATNFLEELENPGSQDDAIVQTVADSKEFASSLLRGIHEFQIALSFFRLSRSLQSSSLGREPVYLSVISHELGLDLHRMDQKSPAHRMYFQRNDVAHQALLAAISLSVSLGDSSSETSNILYIPMTTTTIKTTLPSKTVSPFDDHNPEERNKNVLFANLVITSPSLDLEPRHVSRLLRLFQFSASSSRRKKRNNQNLIPRLLPKASIKLSVHEPVLRFILPIAGDMESADDDYNLLISSISSISLDIESSHSSEGGVHYSLSSTYRVASHQLYYQTPAGVKHSLFTTESMEIKVHLIACPEVYMIASGTLNSFSAHMVNGEVTRGIRQVLEQFQAHMRLKKHNTVLEERKPTFLRRFPAWLLRFHFKATDCSLEIAGIDARVSDVSHGVSLQLESWTADYKAEKSEPARMELARRRTPSYSTIGEDFRFPPTSPPRTSQHGLTDGRRLAIHVRRFQGFVIESDDYLEPEPFFLLPRFEVALTTLSDRLGPLSHINSLMKGGVFLQYSLYRYYCLGVALSVLQDAFLIQFTNALQSSGLSQSSKESSTAHSPEAPSSASQKNELFTVDVRITAVQIKASLGYDPPMMLQLYKLTAGYHRFSAPFVKAYLVRLHAEAPKLKSVWARIVSMNNVRVDFRTAKIKHGASLIEEKSIQTWTDFIRIAVPHQMVMHRIFDNIINTVKACKQLHHRLKHHTKEFVSTRAPEGPKRVPRVTLRSKALLFELEDDAFEWKLGLIYRTGLSEQAQRLAREEAFHMKMQKIKERSLRRATSKLRAQSSHRTLRSGRTSQDTKRSKSADRKMSYDPYEDQHRMGRKYRYDKEGSTCLTSDSKLDTETAWHRLQEHNARSWKKKIDTALRFQHNSIKEVRMMFSGADEPPEDVEETETILSIPNRPGLMAALISDVSLAIDKPTFPLEAYPTYLHEIGKGMPVSMKYALLIPMSLQLDMGEARVNLRDYPLDLIHIPALRPGQSPKLPSWSLRTNLVIAEEFRDHKSARQVKLEIVPSRQLPDGSITPPYALDIWRSVSPVKTYSDPVFEINTSLPTSFSWGVSYQPVIQHMMKIIEGFSKPEIDPSEKVGFWDKIRMSFHSRVRVVWKEDGDVHLRLKGSRDPYVITGFGGGFVMCWHKGVRWNIHTSDDPTEFMSVTSGEYVLAVANYSNEAQLLNQSLLGEHENTPPSRDVKNTAFFKKVVMKLSGDVRWVAGLVFERNPEGNTRHFNFKPHYEVVLQNPDYVDPNCRKDYDAYRGFRSNHIHLSVAVIAPESRHWDVANVEPYTSYNTAHLTPRLFTHFFDWWSLFSAVMSLPIRQGSLWPGFTKTTKKFNRHLATVKYKLLLAPLFVAHVYKHKGREDYADDVVTATGLKVRLDSLKIDVHQRRENINTLANDRLKGTKTTAMRINEAQLDMQAADFRAVSASTGGTALDDLEKDVDGMISSFQQTLAPVDVSRFTIPDQNLDWIDMDDFVELDWILPQEPCPRTQILPLAFTPRFTYSRQTDYGLTDPEEAGFSRFGREPTHDCVMTDNNTPLRVQMELITDRLAMIDTQLRNYESTINEQNVKLATGADHDTHLKSQHELFVRQAESLTSRRNFLLSSLCRLKVHLEREETSPSSSKQEPGTGEDSDSNIKLDDLDRLYAVANEEFASDFKNKFLIHNIQLKWNNSLRNIILRYIHQVSQRRGFVYYMSRRAVKFILDIIDEQSKNKRSHGIYSARSNQHYDDEDTSQNDDDGGVTDRIEQLLKDAKSIVNADGQSSHSDKPTSNTDDLNANISSEFTPQNSYHLRLIAPQIQLQSEKNQKSVLLVAAKDMHLKVVSIMDKMRVYDDVSGLVQRRFSLVMDAAQFFVATQKNLAAHLHFYAGNKYGNLPGSAWPPWLTLEAMFDSQLDPFGFSRIVQRTSASMRYDKFNNLRLKYNEEVAKGPNHRHHGHDCQEARMDQIIVNFPCFRAICNSAEYYSMYIIILDLLLYSDPFEKVRNERLEKIMLSSDFSDMRGVQETVKRLQNRIRQLEEIKDRFQIHARSLDRQGWADRLAVEKDLAQCEDDLFFMMKAITTSQRRAEPITAQNNGLLRWHIRASEVVWHLMRHESEPLVEFQLRNAKYDRTDNRDGSNNNLVAIERLYGLNLLPEAIYPQIIAPYLDGSRNLNSSDDYMMKVQWHMLEAVAGIPVVDEFEVSLIPLKIQLERDLGQKVFEYIFPRVGSNAFEQGGFSPFMIKNMKPLEDDDSSGDEDNTTTNDLSPSTTQTPANAASVELRLQPTLTLPDNDRSQQRLSQVRSLEMTPLYKSDSRLSLSQTISQFSRPSSALSKKRSYDSLGVLTRADKSQSSLSGKSSNEEKSRKFNLGRRGEKSKQSTDDLSEMMSRASNYMTLAHVKVNDAVLCLSYKGKGDRSLGDLHDFVFKLPILEYRNKTWSNLDLAMRLKKDVYKVIITHAPAILGNKLSHHRPSKQEKRRLHELATSSQILRSSDSTSNTMSDYNQTGGGSHSTGENSRSPSHRSMTSNGSPPLGRSTSFESSRSSSQIQSPLNSSFRSTPEPAGDSRWELSRRFVNQPSRSTASDGTISTVESNGNSDVPSESHRRAILDFGRRLINHGK